MSVETDLAPTMGSVAPLQVLTWRDNEPTTTEVNAQVPSRVAGEVSEHGGEGEDDVMEGDIEEPDGNEKEIAVEELDLGVLLQAMHKCIDFYHQKDKCEFYAMVSEEYGALLPDREEVPVDAIAQMETILQRLATARISTLRLPLPRTVEPHADVLLAFYRALGASSGSAVTAGEGSDEIGGDARLDALPAETHSPGGQTDGSASNPATPQEDRVRNAVTNGTSDLTSYDHPSLQQQSETSTQLTEVSTKNAPTSLVDTHKPQFTYTLATSTIADLTKTHVESKQRLRDAEELLKVEKASAQKRKREYKQLKTLVKQYRQRNVERKRLRMLIEGDTHRDGDRSHSDDDTDRPSMQELRHTYRKEMKRCKRLQETLSLRYQLLESKNKGFEMEVEKRMGQLRSEYTDSFVFGSLDK